MGTLTVTTKIRMEVQKLVIVMVSALYLQARFVVFRTDLSIREYRGAELMNISFKDEYMIIVIRKNNADSNIMIGC